MMVLSRELRWGQHHNACKMATSFNKIQVQRTFKNVALLGGVEQALMAMKEVIWQ